MLALFECGAAIVCFTCIVLVGAVHPIGLKLLAAVQ